MSIFRREEAPSSPKKEEPSPREKKPKSPPPRERAKRSARSGNRSPSQIAPGCKIEGEIEGKSDLVVDGEVEGRIRLDSNLTVGREGRVQGDISARHVRIGGRVVGNVEGREKVEILDSGRLEGDVVAPRVVLAEGAFFKGKVQMSGTGSPRAGAKGKPR